MKYKYAVAALIFYMKPPHNDFGMTHKESADYIGVATLSQAYQTSETILSK